MNNAKIISANDQVASSARYIAGLYVYSIPPNMFSLTTFTAIVTGLSDTMDCSQVGIVDCGYIAFDVRRIGS